MQTLTRKPLWTATVVLGVAGTLLAGSTRNPIPMLLGVPVLRQVNEYSCGASALASALGYYGQERRETELMTELGTTPAGGTDIYAMRDSARLHGLKAEVRTGLSVRDLEKSLRAKQLAILCLQAWREPEAKDYTDIWEDGHYVVLIGMDAHAVYFMDPAMLGGRGFIPLSEFPSRWHDVGENGVQFRNAALILDGTPNPPATWQKIP